jgi:hypothetical protein
MFLADLSIKLKRVYVCSWWLRNPFQEVNITYKKYARIILRRDKDRKGGNLLCIHNINSDIKKNKNILLSRITVAVKHTNITI